MRFNISGNSVDIKNASVSGRSDAASGTPAVPTDFTSINKAAPLTSASAPLPPPSGPQVRKPLAVSLHTPTLGAAAYAHMNDEDDVRAFISEVINEAITRRASDVHFEPHIDRCVIRYRVDGILSIVMERSLDDFEAILNALKLLAGMDIAVRHLPQDGNIELMSNVEIHERQDGVAFSSASPEDAKYFDLRASAFPGVRGEVMVIRILNRATALHKIDEIGLDEETLQKLHWVLASAYGMVLVSGPTGSGKTTTLYSILGELRGDDRLIMTLEDPVEFHLDWMRQCEIKESRNFTFEVAMESILRQDPDVLMVGEIRDPHTAEYAVRIALAGRVVGSTIHANSAVGTIARLLELGIPRSLLAHAINGIIAQRLVRKLCPHCKVPYTPNPLYALHLGLNVGNETYYHGGGCDACKGTGFIGRIGLFSVLSFSESFRNMIFDQRSLAELERSAIEEGMRTLKGDAVLKIKAGYTTAEEVAKVL